MVELSNIDFEKEIENFLFMLTIWQIKKNVLDRVKMWHMFSSHFQTLGDNLLLKEVLKFVYHFMNVVH